jgi:hypothetical protein
MYLSAERLALANQTITETFEQSSVAWQAIPHWNTGDPAQTKVQSDVTSLLQTTPPATPAPDPLGEDPVDITSISVPFLVTLAQATAATPDALLAAVIARAVYLAKAVDDKVIGAVKDAAQPAPGDNKDADTAKLLTALIGARVAAESYGYRAPSCLLTNTVAFTKLNQLEDGYSVLEPLLTAANANSLHRADKLVDGNKGTLILLGRRQLIAHGDAAAASPGEEPVDIAVSVPPSLEVVGETKAGYIQLAIRIRFAPRVKDKYGVIGVAKIT